MISRGQNSNTGDVYAVMPKRVYSSALLLRLQKRVDRRTFHDDDDAVLVILSVLRTSIIYIVRNTSVVVQQCTGKVGQQ